MHCSPPASSVHGDSPGKNIGVGCHALLQGIFLAQGSNPGFLHCRRILYQLEPPGKPKNTGVVAYPFSRGSSWPTNRTKVSYIAGRFFTSWATREALGTQYVYEKRLSCVYISMGFLGGSYNKRVPAMQKIRVQSLGWENPLEKGLATHSSILSWTIPWTEKPGGQQYMRPHINWTTLSTDSYCCRSWAVFLYLQSFG